MLSIGESRYLSTLPLYSPLRANLAPSQTLVLAGLTELTERLAAQNLDAGPIGVFEYFMAPERFEILPGVALSSLGRSLCVSLFSRRPAYELANARIAVPFKATGPVALLRWLMREMYRFEPTLVPRKGDLKESMADNDGVLLFQDAALLAHAGTADLYHVWDLGEAWWQITNTPLVYMLWATRKGLPRTDFEAVERAFEQARTASPSMAGPIVEEAELRTSLPRPFLEGYFTRFQFECTAFQREGLELYRQTVANQAT